MAMKAKATGSDKIPVSITGKAKESL